MKQSVTIGIFIVLAVVIIAVGSWYGNKLSEESQQAATQQAVAAAQAAAQAQAAMMQNFKVTDVKVGTGAVAEDGDTVSVLYTGTLDDGTVFDASSLHGNQPFSFVLGQQQVIQGWDLGVVGMKVGGKRDLVIPPGLAYGAQGFGTSVPSNATLHFTVQLVGVSSTVQ